MSDQSQQALEWAKANPKDPRSQKIQAKLWAQSNPDDPRSEQIMNAISKNDATPPQNAFNVADSMEHKEKETRDPLNPMSDPEIKKTWEFLKVGMSPDQVGKMGSNALLPGMGAKMAEGMGGLGRLGIGAMMGATQGAMKPDGDPALNALGGGATGLLVGSGMEGLNAAAGGLKGAASGLALGGRDAIQGIKDSATKIGSSDGIADLLKNILASKAGLVKAGPAMGAQATIQGIKGAASSLSGPTNAATDPRTLSALMNTLK